MNPGCVLLADHQGLSAVSGVEDDVAVATKDASDDDPHLIVILDEKNRLAAARVLGARALRRADLDVAVDAWEVDLECRPLAGLAVEPDVAAALLHDPENHREAEAGPFAQRLGREKRLEDARLRRGVDALARVADSEHHVRARSHVDVRPRVLLVEHHVRRLDRELPPAEHGVARVDGEVHQDLLHLTGVGLHVPQVDRGENRQRDVGAEQAPKHPLHSYDALTKVEHLRLEHLLTAEGEELFREVRGPHPCCVDLFDVGAEDLVELELGADHFCVAEDDGQDVVEVVRDAAG